MSGLLNFIRGPRPRLDGAQVLITGASAGLGAEFARQLATRARTLILVARRSHRLEELKTELERLNPRLKTVIRVCDLSRTGDVEAMVTSLERELGAIDILINNAGFGDIGLVEHSDWAKLDQMIAVNVTALTYLTRRLLPSMIARGQGASGILMVGSSSGLQTLPGVAAYSGTKYYVRGLADALRAEVRAQGVTVTTLAPGPVATEFAAVAVENTLYKAPGFIEIDSPRCVRSALRAFERGRAVVIPGIAINIVMAIQAVTPRFVLRWFVAAVALVGRQLLMKIAHDKRAALDAPARTAALAPTEASSRP